MNQLTDISSWLRRNLTSSEDLLQSFPEWLGEHVIGLDLQSVFLNERFIIPSCLDPVRAVFAIKNEATRPFLNGLRTVLESLQVELLEIDTQGKAPLNDVWARDAAHFLISCQWKEGDVKQELHRLPGLRAKFALWDAAAMENTMEQVLAQLNIRKALEIEAAASNNFIDWFGNLVISPPVQNAEGKCFPFGRILIGAKDDKTLDRRILDFLEVSALQWPPVVVDVSWSLVGHVDEAVAFVPCRRSRERFRVLVPGPRLTRDLLEQWVARGHGGARLFEGCEFQGCEGYEPGTTVKRLLERFAYSPVNKALENTIEQMKEQLQRELGIPPTSFIEVPYLLTDEGWDIIPNAVNGLLVGSTYIVPDPHGPVVDGRDLFFEYLHTALANCDIKLCKVETWHSHHLMGGEVHCGTNEIRGLLLPAFAEAIKLRKFAS